MAITMDVYLNPGALPRRRFLGTIPVTCSPSPLLSPSVSRAPMSLEVISIGEPPAFEPCPKREKRGAKRSEGAILF